MLNAVNVVRNKPIPIPRPKQLRNPTALYAGLATYTQNQQANLSMKRMYSIRTQCLESCSSQLDSRAIVKTSVWMMKQLLQESTNIRGRKHRITVVKFILKTVVMEPFNILLRWKKFRGTMLEKIKDYVSTTGNRSFGKWCRSKVARVNVY